MKDVTDYGNADIRFIAAFRVAGEMAPWQQKRVAEGALHFNFTQDVSGIFRARSAPVKGCEILGIADDAELEPGQMRLLAGA